MKTKSLLFFFIVLLGLSPQVRATVQTTAENVLFSDSFDTDPTTRVSDPWVVTGDDIGTTFQNKNWKYMPYDFWMQSGAFFGFNATDVYTLTSPLIAIGTHAVDLSFSYALNNLGSDVKVYALIGGVRKPLNFTFQNTGRSVFLEAQASIDSCENQNIQIVFEHTACGGTFQLDDVQITEQPDCPAAAEVNITNLDTTSVQLNWTGSTTSNHIVLITTTPQSSPETAPASQTFSRDTVSLTKGFLGYSYNVTGLSIGTTYYVYIKTDCTSSLHGYGAWSDEFHFSTLCTALGVPYTENFNATPRGDLPLCWMVTTTYGTLPMVQSELSGDTHASNILDIKNNKNQDIMMVLPAFTTNIEDLMLTFEAKAEYPSNMQIAVGITNDITDPSSMATLFTFNLTQEWTEYTAFMNNPYFTGLDYYIVLYVPSGLLDTGDDFNLYLDNVVVDDAPDCLFPLLLSIDHVQDTSCDLTFEDKNVPATNDYTLEYTPTGGVSQTVNITTSSYTLTGLLPNTEYSLRVRTNCSATSYSPYTTAQKIKTLSTPLEVGLDAVGTEDFEGSTSYLVMANGTQVNQWVIGEAAAKSPSHALYISSDRGISLGIDPSAFTMTYAYMDVRFPAAGRYRLRYNWKGNGNTSAYWNIHLAPASFTPTAGQGYYDASGQSIAIGESKNMATEGAAWENEKLYFNVSEAGIKRVVFYWYSSNYGSEAKYAVIDDLEFYYMACDFPTQFKSTSVTSSQVDLSWHGASASYNIKAFTREIPTDSIDLVSDSPVVNSSVVTQYSSISGLSDGTIYYFYLQGDCGSTSSDWVSPVICTTDCAVKDLPYSNDFNADLDGIVPICWVGTDSKVSVISYPNVDYNIDDTGVLAFTGDKTVETYAILPEFNVPLAKTILDFDYHFQSSYYSGDMVVGYLTTGTNVLSFRALDTLQAVSGVAHATIELTDVDPSLMGRLAFKILPYVDPFMTYGSSIDNVMVYKQPTCFPIASFNRVTHMTQNEVTISWLPNGNGSKNFVLEYGPEGFTFGTGTSVNITNDSSYTITGLTPNTFYDVYVATDCGAVDGVADYRKKTVQTSVIPQDATSYFCGFEDEGENANWRFAGSEYINHWAIGNQSSHGGAQGLYVVKPNGNLGYGSDVSESWVYRVMHCPTPGYYVVEFDYECDAELSYDYMQSVVAPEAFLFQSGDNAGCTATAIPSEWSTGEPQFLSSSATWMHYSYGFEVTSAKDITLAFHWTNDSYNANSPAQVDNVAVNYVTCRPAENVTLSNLSTTSATLHWTSGTFDHFQVVVTKASYANNELDTISAATAAYFNDALSARTVDLSALESNTSYFVYIRSICSASDTAAWSKAFAFRTLCSVQALPYRTSFSDEDVATIPLCWTLVSDGTIAQVDQSDSYDKGQSLYLEAADATSLTLALPTVTFTEDIDRYQLVFYMKRSEAMSEAVDVSLAFFTSEDISDAASYYSVASDISITEAEKGIWKRIVVPFTHPTDIMTGDLLTLEDDQAIVLQIAGPAKVFLDAVRLEALPSCQEPFHCSIDSVGARTMSLSWDGTASSYEVEYTNLDDESVHTRTVSNDSVILTGLNPHTRYAVQVRALCTPTELSSWTQELNFTTDCAPEALPYVENFNAYKSADLPICWMEINSAYRFWTLVKNPLDASDRFIHSGKESLSVFNYDLSLYTPELDMTTATNGLLSFEAKADDPLVMSTSILIREVLTGRTDTLVSPLLMTTSWTSYALDVKKYAGKVVKVIFASSLNKANGFVSYDNIELSDRLYLDKPTGLRVEGTTTSSAVVKVNHDPAVSAHRIALVPENEDFDEATAVMSLMNASDSVVLSGLSAHTFYKVYAQAVKGSDYSKWVGPVSFNTACSAYALPLFETFETKLSGSLALPICWNTQGLVSADTVPLVGEGSVKLGKNGKLITPEISDALSGAELFFYAKSLNGASLVVSASTSATDMSGLLELETVTATGDYGLMQHVALSAVPSTYHYLVIQNKGEESVQIDNLSIEDYSSCRFPRNFTVSRIQKGKAVVNITDTELSSYDIYYGLTENTRMSALTPTMENVTAQTWITGLLGNENYSVYVRRHCGATAGKWIGPVEFHSACSAFTITAEHPFVEDFAAFTTTYFDVIPDCWNQINSTGSEEAPYVYVDADEEALKVCSSSEDTVFFVLPEFTNALNTLNLSFKLSPEAAISDLESQALQIGTMSDPSEVSSFQSLKTVKLVDLNPYLDNEVLIDMRYIQVPVDHHYIALRVAGEVLYFKFSEFTVSLNMMCGEPLVELLTSTSDGAQLQVTTVATALRYDLAIQSADKSYRDTIVGLTSQDYTLTGLTSGEDYFVRARSYCSAGSVEDTTLWTSAVEFVVPFASVSTFPYTCNFEDETENSQWLHPQGDITNHWMIGLDSKGVYDGAKGLYVTNDGVNAYYDPTSYASTWATRMLHLIPGVYTISFKARVGGDEYSDYMRAFLVESDKQLLTCDYVKHPERANFDGQALESTNDLPGFIDLLGTATHLYDQLAWTTYTYHLTVMEARDYQLGFMWKNNKVTGLQPGACVDHISVTYNGCPQAKNIEIVSVKSTAIKATGLDELEIPGTTLHYVVVRQDSALTPENIVSEISAVAGSVVEITGLQAVQNYDLYVAQICDDMTYGDWSEPLSFHTLKPAGVVPYFCSFEATGDDTDRWVFNNDDTNKWIVGDAIATQGSQSLFISNNNLAYQYDQTKAQYSYAIRNMHFDKGTYALSFDWECLGEGFSDYMYVFVVPETSYPEGGQTSIEGSVLSATMEAPKDGFKFGPFSGRSLSSSFKSYFDLTHNADMNLVIAWVNDYSRGANPPAMIDHLKITQVACPTPTNIRVTDLTSSTATLAWDSDADKVHLTIFDPVLATSLIDTVVTADTVVVTGLMSQTTYQYQMNSLCMPSDTGVTTALAEFTTICDLYATPYTEDFNTDEELPSCWTIKEGLADLSGETDGTTLSDGLIGWVHQVSPVPHMSTSLYGAGKKHWLLSPMVTLTEQATLTFDLALTAYNSWTYPSTYDADDAFAVLISRDYGLSWNPLETWTDASPLGHRLRDIGPVFERIQLNVTPNADGRPIQLAFYAVTTEDGADNELHLDNVHLNCLDSEVGYFTDTVCQGYAYANYGFVIPEQEVMTGTFHRYEYGTGTDCDQIKQLDLVVNPKYEVYTTATICAGQSYPFGALDLTQGGNYKKNLYAKTGCDSIINLYLVVTQLERSIDTTICEGSSFTLGTQTITSEGFYTDTVMNAEGCDSVTNYTVHVLPTVFNQDTTICEGNFIEIGTTQYTTSGLYSQTLTNRLGCDSVVTIALTVIPHDTTYTDYVCDGAEYNFRGTIVTGGGTYRDTVHHYLGSTCDYIYTLNLVETAKTMVDISGDFCEGATSYNQYGFSINNPEEKDYILTKTSAVTGCDSITTLHLHKVATLYGTEEATICDGEKYVFGGKEYYSVGSYDHAFTAVSTGCDSIVTLTLKVNPSYNIDVQESVLTSELPYTNLTLVVPKGTPAGNYSYKIETKTGLGCDSIINLDLTVKHPDGLNALHVSTLNFYPNVVNVGEEIFITTPLTRSERVGVTVGLYDAVGKLISSYSPSLEGEMHFAVPHVSGLYFVRMSTQGGKIYSGKLIVL